MRRKESVRTRRGVVRIRCIYTCICICIRALRREKRKSTPKFSAHAACIAGNILEMKFDEARGGAAAPVGKYKSSTYGRSVTMRNGVKRGDLHIFQSARDNGSVAVATVNNYYSRSLYLVFDRPSTPNES